MSRPPSRSTQLVIASAAWQSAGRNGQFEWHFESTAGAAPRSARLWRAGVFREAIDRTWSVKEYAMVYQIQGQFENETSWNHDWAQNGSGETGAPSYTVAAQNYARLVNPHLSDLLARLRLDVCFVRGEGHWLVDADGNRYLDAVSGYGAVPFGHNPDCIWQAIRAFDQAREPCMAQPSLLPGAGALAEALLRDAPQGMRSVVFGNSGAEAIEAAIKACRMATGKLGIISTENGFHGKTLGALSATGRPYFQQGSGAPVSGFRRVPYGDADALEDALRECASETAAFVVEPIQGEGGVIEPPAGYLRVARRLCDRHGVLLIVDEVQTGLGRTGVLFGCLSEGIVPDAITLAKALGGGIFPVSACLLSERAYCREFALRHSSTFAGNALGMRIGLRVLERLKADDGALLENVVRQGSYLKRGLKAIQQQYVSTIREVRGRGLMLGVELGTDRSLLERGVGSFMALLGDSLAVFAASYLLNECHVRVAPTMNGSHVLRVQPPLTVTREECDVILRAFRQLASVIALGQSDRLVSPVLRPRRSVLSTPSDESRRDSNESDRSSDSGVHRVGSSDSGVHRVASNDPNVDQVSSDDSGVHRVASNNLGVHQVGSSDSGVYKICQAIDREGTQQGPEGRFAFILHLLDSKSWADFDGSLGRLDRAELDELVARFDNETKPWVASTVRIESATGQTAVGDFIVLCKTAAQLLRLSPEDALEEVMAAVRVGKERGAKIVGLGGYTSVVAQNLRGLMKIGVALTTGNSYTVVSAIDAALAAAQITGRRLESNRAAIVGGGGSIGSALASLLAERVASLVLVGRSDSAGARDRYAVVLGRMIRHLARRRREGAVFKPGCLAEALSRLPCSDELAESHGRLQLTGNEEQRVLDEVAHLPIRWTTALGPAVAESDLIFLATSSPEALIRSEMVSPGSVICDLSRPANVSPDISLRRDVLVIDGGIVEVPGRPNLGFHFGLAPGLAYACMAETMMLALERHYEHTSLGRDLQEATLDRFRGLADKHGFRLAELRARQRPLDMSMWRDDMSMWRDAAA